MTAFNNSSLTRTVQPAREPVSMELLRLHVRVDGNYDDQWLHRCISAARQEVEAWTDLALIDQGWLLQLDGWWPTCGVSLPKSPIVSIDEIQYLDTSDPAVLVTLPTDQYILDAEQRLLTWAPGVTPPSLASGRVQRVKIQYTAGFGATPEDLESKSPSVAFACLQMAGWLYQNRGDTMDDLPPTYKHLATSILQDYL